MSKDKTKEDKLYHIEIMFLAPVEGAGIIGAQTEKEAIDKIKEMYHDVQGMEIMSIKETTIEELNQAGDTLNEDDSLTVH